METALMQLSEALAAAVEQIGRSLVQIDARRRFPASGIVWSTDGVVVTNNHVVHRDNDIRVVLPDGRTTAGEIIGRDETTDLIAIRTDATDLVVPRWSTHEALRVGHLALAVGNPGTGPRATLGMISLLGPAWSTRMSGRIDAYIESDIAIFLGFSGGPLLDASGGIIGLNSSALIRGASVAIPSATVARVAAMLVEHGQVQRGYIGVSSYPVDIPASLVEELGQERGLLVVSVEPGSPAEAAGIMLGDVLLAIGGTPTGSAQSLRGAVGAGGIGSEVEITLLRGGKHERAQATIAARP